MRSEALVRPAAIGLGVERAGSARSEPLAVNASPVVTQAVNISAPMAHDKIARLGPRKRFTNMGKPPRTRSLRADNGGHRRGIKAGL